ncbi:TRAP transporter small permease subunit [Pseudooceanicola sediminis]|uniref:TRAP transporter small permease protein n=1 Tax=Pseudooceanicola sediminis TaxID=2211117 RepID=A0A399J310_9RHOB|nr:TRAP transporter small permease subunit [Pseudooceanicola sediminis]KAA2317287.1 TRAP transporter small permease subunit [Puniceibacterium sp. HSS470]RII39641.1 TRAP transporter small permease subunit [Pseudooceanicola sediminis]|tara:strand:- start:19366 stop:19944 length:579 start_codon:yes stop_codon:yes gene_type:complete
MSAMTFSSLQRPFRRALRGLLVTIVGALLVIMIVQIVLRYGFSASLLWAEEVCRYLLIWLAFLAVPLAFERGEVASLTFLSVRMARVPALVLASVTALLSLILCLLLVYYGWRFADMAGRATIPAIRFILEDLFGANAPEAPGTFWVYVALPVGMGLLALRLIGDLVLCLRAISSGDTLGDILMRTETELAE